MNGWFVEWVAVRFVFIFLEMQQFVLYCVLLVFKDCSSPEPIMQHTELLRLASRLVDMMESNVIFALNGKLDESIEILTQIAKSNGWECTLKGNRTCEVINRTIKPYGHVFVTVSQDGACVWYTKDNVMVSIDSARLRTDLASLLHERLN